MKHQLHTCHWSDLILNMQLDSDFYNWAKTIPNYSDFWDACPQGNWLTYFAYFEGSTPEQEIVKAGCKSARAVLHLIDNEKGKQFAIKSIETAEAWTEGRATEDEMKAANDACRELYWKERTTASAVALGSALSLASDPAADPTRALFYANKSDPNAKAKANKQVADIVRSVLKCPTKEYKEFEKYVANKAFI